MHHQASRNNTHEKKVGAVTLNLNSSSCFTFKFPCHSNRSRLGNGYKLAPKYRTTFELPLEGSSLMYQLNFDKESQLNSCACNSTPSRVQELPIESSSFQPLGMCSRIRFATAHTVRIPTNAPQR